MEEGDRSRADTPIRVRPLALVVSGAPGSGKTTLALKLSALMGLPHLNKDLMCGSLIRGGIQQWRANKRAFELVYGTARCWLQEGVSLVMDMTMYAAYSPAEVASLRPYGVVINLHVRCQDALARWEAKMRERDGPDLEEQIARIRGIHQELAEPLDFRCPRLDIATDDGYEPDVNTILGQIERMYRASVW